MPVRTAGKRGKLPVKPAGERFAIKYVHEYLAAPLPAPVYPVDVSAGITGWGMLGNGPDPTCTTHPDGVGDCYFACRQHYRMAKAAADHAPMPTETSNELVAEYLLYDHGQDIGVSIADVLLAEYRAGIILGFAPVDHTDRAACDAAMAKFHGLILGGDLTDDADELFEDHEPWTVSSDVRPDSADGHCFLRVKSTGPHPSAMSTDVTWGADQESTAAWDAACITEAWVAILSEDEMEPGELAALRADIDALDDVEAAAPPGDSPDLPPHAGFLMELADEVEGTLSKVRGYLFRHGIL